MHPNKGLNAAARAQAFIQYGNQIAVLLQQATTAESPVQEAAIRYAVDRDWHVFPAHSSGERKSHKSAEHSNGRQWGATNDLSEIRRDFSRWRLANIGIPTGAINGIFVLDVDTIEGHGVDGIASMRELEARHGQLPETLTVVSPSGSRHYYFQHPGTKVKNSTSELGPGIDVRGDGGMVIAPPSRGKHGGEYKWLDEGASPVAAPEWLVQRVTEARQSASTAEPEADIDELAAALAAIPNDKDWQEWNKVGMALWRATGGSDEGFELFDTWSKKHESYDEGYTAQRWQTYFSCPPTQIGAGSIFYMASEARRAQIARDIEIGDDIDAPVLPAIMTLAEMHERLIFVGSTGAVVDRQTGRIRKKEAATDEYAASRHRGKPALKAWIASGARVTVDTLAWVPGEPQICRPPESDDGSATAYNSWRGLKPIQAPEDWIVRVEPFVEHAAYLIPVEAERQRFLQFVAHIAQHPEVLPHTYYLMITPTTGIGRGLLGSILTRAFRGHVAAGISLPELLDGGFNGRLSKKLLAIVDEAREGSSPSRFQRAERLKSLVTETHRLINPKYGHQSVEKNCCRWLMFSNHYDAIPFDNSDRRAIVIENPTVRKPSRYYQRLFALLEDNDFIGSVRRYLETMEISSFRPGEHAPMNEAKGSALEAMMTDTERACVEFKETCETELAFRSAIAACVPGAVNEGHLTHAIRRAGMINTGRRVRIDGVPATIVIVRGEWTREMVKAASDEVLLAAAGSSGRSGNL
jgi:hypothetical protein